MAAALNLHLKQHWRELSRGRPGSRFQNRYERARRSAKNGVGLRIALLAAGFLCLAVGVLFAVIPGPAIPFFFLAGGLLATESLMVARWMDWIEVRVRKIFSWGKRHWRRLPRAARIALIILGACGSAGSAYLSYRMIRG